MFTLTIRTENAAFGDGDPTERAREVARILRDLAKRLDNGGHLNGTVRDLNGNTVGEHAHA